MHIFCLFETRTDFGDLRGGDKASKDGDLCAICDKINLLLKQEQKQLLWVTFGLVLQDNEVYCPEIQLNLILGVRKMNKQD